jgi:hypothetical protein
VASVWLECSGDARERLPGEWVMAALAMMHQKCLLVFFYCIAGTRVLLKKLYCRDARGGKAAAQTCGAKHTPWSPCHRQSVEFLKCGKRPKMRYFHTVGDTFSCVRGVDTPELTPEFGFIFGALMLGRWPAKFEPEPSCTKLRPRAVLSTRLPQPPRDNSAAAAH